MPLFAAEIRRIFTTEELRAYIGDRPLSSTNVRSESFDLPVPAHRFGKELRLEGLRKRELVAATRVPLR